MLQLNYTISLQQFRDRTGLAPRYYSDKNSELDLLLQNGTEIIPVEIKSGENKSVPSFKHYLAEHPPMIGIRYSKLGYTQNDTIINIPLYLACKTMELLPEMNEI